MSEHGNESVAALFMQLSRFEAEYVYRLTKQTVPQAYLPGEELPGDAAMAQRV